MSFSQACIFYGSKKIRYVFCDILPLLADVVVSDTQKSSFTCLICGVHWDNHHPDYSGFLWIKLVLFCFVFCLFVCFWDRVSLCSPGWPGTHSVDQAGLELTNPPASASQVLGLKACPAMILFLQMWLLCVYITCLHVRMCLVPVVFWSGLWCS